MKRTFLYITLSIPMLMVACNQGPQVITPTGDSEKTSNTTGIFTSNQEGGSSAGMANDVAPVSGDDLHTVKVNEVIPAQKYTYVNVSEGHENYWVATRKQEVQIGGEYYYKGGLMKTNFESKEHNRVFDKIYLISQMVPTNHTHPEAVTIETHQPFDNQPSVASDSKIRDFQVEGSIKIKELVENKEKYAGKEVQLSGEVTKVNPNIMGRNWVHLKDGSKDDYDLVITTDYNIPEGSVVTLKGTVTLDKDFGAGYFYEIIVEGASKVE